MKKERFVEISDLTVSFPGGIEAIRSLNLIIKEGEFVSLVGASGCGKSTLLKVISGLLKPSSGNVTIDGLSPHQARKKQHDIAFVFQEATLLPWRRVIENVYLPLELRNIPCPKEKLLSILQLVGLEEFAFSYPAQLSGGMKMRVSLARALIMNPQIMLLDEPFGALDEITRQKLNEELLTLCEKESWTSLFVTHNVFEAVFLSHRVLVLSPRPARVIADISVPFSYPRSPELRGSAEFAQVVGEVSHHLRQAQ